MNRRSQPQQRGIRAASATYTTAHGNAGSLTHWERPGIESATLWFSVGFVNHWATTGTPKKTYLKNFLFFSFFFFFGHAFGMWKCPGQGSNQSCSCRPTPKPQQHQIWAASVTYTTAQGNARSLTHWMRPGIKPVSSWMLVRFVICFHWATTGTPL